MTKVTYGVTASLDGFIAGNNMSLKESFANIPADLLMDWRFIESEKHQAKIDSLTTAGAFIMDSNMFEPKDHRMTLDWKG